MAVRHNSYLAQCLFELELLSTCGLQRFFLLLDKLAYFSAEQTESEQTDRLDRSQTERQTDLTEQTDK